MHNFTSDRVLWLVVCLFYFSPALTEASLNKRIRKAQDVTQEFSHTGKLIMPRSLCSGVMICPGMVATALHCYKNNISGKDNLSNGEYKKSLFSLLPSGSVAKLNHRNTWEVALNEKDRKVINTNQGHFDGYRILSKEHPLFAATSSSGKPIVTIQLVSVTKAGNLPLKSNVSASVG